jgi:hypothetical protein
MPRSRAEATGPTTRKYLTGELAELLESGPRQMTSKRNASARAVVETVLMPSPLLHRRPSRAARFVVSRWARALLVLAAPLVGAAAVLLALLVAHRIELRARAGLPHPLVRSASRAAASERPASPPAVTTVLSAKPEPIAARTPYPTPSQATLTADPNITPATAASAFSAGHYADALAAYRMLAATRRTTEAYGIIARILERKLQARCDKPIAAGAIPCAPLGD